MAHPMVKDGETIV